MYLTRHMLLAALLASSTGVLAATLQGQITDTEGRPLAKAQITLHHQKHDKAVTVYSDDEGYYALTLDTPGTYRLRSRRIGYNTVTETALELNSQDSLQRDMTLKSIPKATWIHELPASDWYQRVTFSSRDLRGQFAIQCAMCHQQGASTTKLIRSEEEWHQLFDLMGEFGASMTQALYDEAPSALNAAFDGDQLDLDSFPDDPVARYNGNVVITEWSIGHPTAFLHDMAVGPGGTIYTVDWINDKLFALDPESDKVKAWSIPIGDLEPGGILGQLAERGRRYLHHTPTVAPHSLQVGPDGAIWITLSTGLGLTRFDTDTEQFTHFDHPKNVLYPHTLRFDGQGNVWYTASMTNHVVKLDTRTGEFSVYNLPTQNITQWLAARSMRFMVWLANAFSKKPDAVVSDPEIHPVPYGIDVTPDGKVWFTQFNNRHIGYIDPNTEQVEVIETPFYGPRRMRSDSKGILWIPSYNNGRFYRFDPRDQQFTEYTVPTGEGDLVYALAIDPRDDSVWLCGTNSDTIMHFDPEADAFKVYQLPTRVSFTRELEVDEQGNVWTSTSNMPYYQVEGMRGKLVRLSFPHNDGDNLNRSESE